VERGPGLRHFASFEVGDVNALVTSLREPGLRTKDRKRLVHYLGKLADRRATDMLCETLLNDSEVDLRAAAARALGAVRDVRSRSALERASEDRASAVRAWAVDALGALGDPGGRVAVRARLDDDDEVVRAYACRVSGELRDEAAVPGLQRNVLHSRRLVATNAARALSDIATSTATRALDESLARLSRPRRWLVRRAAIR
jgi:HEAT repeat protein